MKGVCYWASFLKEDMMRRLVVTVCGFVAFWASATPTMAEPINAAIQGTDVPVRFGPFPNAPGVDKDFGLSGGVMTFFDNTNVNVRFCWHANANQNAPQACSNYFQTAYGNAGNYAINNTFTLLGNCPLTVWVDVRANKSIDIFATFTHVCRRAVPAMSAWGMGALALLLLTGVAFKFSRRRAVT